MNQPLATCPTAEVANAEHLANAMAQWPAFARGHTCCRTNTLALTGGVAGSEYRAETGQREWPVIGQAS